MEVVVAQRLGNVASMQGTWKLAGPSQASVVCLSEALNPTLL